MTKVLIATEADWARARLRDVLEELGCEVIEAGDGQDALDLAVAKKPALVVVSQRLPLIDGLSVAVLLKGGAETKNIPVLAICDLDLKTRNQARAAGCDQCLALSLDRADLLAQLRKFLISVERRPK
ncbi:response regulator [Thermosulfuriphilus sp.]